MVLMTGNKPISDAVIRKIGKEFDKHPIVNPKKLEQLTFEKLVDTAKTLGKRAEEFDILHERAIEATLNKSETAQKLRKEAHSMVNEPLVSLGFVLQLREQWKNLVDSIPIDMQKVGRRFEVYSLGTKRQWVDWLVRYNQMTGDEGLREVLGSEKEGDKQ